MIRIVDLFAGIGGIRKGFEQAAAPGHINCVFTSEIDKYAVETYIANFGNENIHGDITLDEVNGIVPPHDILLAGFPCQPFSQAGLKRGFTDPRGTLFFYIDRILNNVHPQAFLLENVKQLRGHDRGRTLQVILDHLGRAGYNTFVTTLKARDFGLPQNRERIFIVGFLDHNIDFHFPEPNGIPTRVGNILQQNVAPRYTISDRLWAGHQRRRMEHQERGNGFGFSLVDEDSEYTNTLSARYYKDGSEILIRQENMNPRKLTPRECARLQGFPDDFIIPVSDVQAYKQFGNSVSVNVIQAIAQNMIIHIREEDQNQNIIAL